ncbi:MAG: hypothetical protein GWO44_25745, partial [Thermoplasmata archaeon]|nr:hypothetical protein [Thermoplasmata archaeon]NIY06576.1 hypothetical protein [Thermoplasmata archaeon]
IEESLHLAGFKTFDAAVYVQETMRLLELDLYDQSVPGDETIVDKISSPRAIR